MFSKTLIALALLLTAIALPAATPSADAPTALTEDAARAQFAALDAVRAAAKDGTDERAKAAQNAGGLAGIIAWDEFDAGHYDEAATWFAAQAKFNREFYVNESAFYATVKKPEFDKTQAGLEAAFAKWRAQLAAETDPKKKAALQSVVNGIPDTRAALAEGYLTEMENLADGAGDQAARLGFEQQELALRQATLKEMQQIGAPPEKILKQQGRIASSLSSIGYVQERLAQFDAAEKSFTQALALRRSLPAEDAERDVEGSLADLGGLYDQKGELPRARAFYEQALKAIEDNQPVVQKALAAGPPPEYAGLDQKTVDGYMAERRQWLIAGSIMTQTLTWNNLAAVIKDMGDYKTALDDYAKAMAVLETLPADSPAAMFQEPMRAKNLNNIAVAHGESGQIDQAIHEELAVLDLDKKLGRSAATVLNNLAGWYAEKGDVEKARLYTEQARRDYIAAQDLRGVISASVALATLAQDAGNLADAEANAQSALTVARSLGDLGWRGGAARSLAAVRLKQGRLDEADTLLAEAAATDAQAQAPLSAEYTDDLQGRVLEARGQPVAALAKYKSAIDLLESVRATAASAAEFSDKKDTYRVYERIVTLLIKLGRPQEAFDYYNRAGSTRLQDSLRRAGVQTSDKGLQALLDRAQGLQIQQKTLTSQLQATQAKPAAEQNPDTIKNLQYQIAATQGEFFQVTDALRKKDKNLYAAVVTVKPTELSDAQASIPADVALIEYAPLGDGLYIFVATHDSLKVFHPPVTPDALNARIKAARAQLSSPDSAAPTPVRGTEAVPTRGETDSASLTDNLSALYDMLIAPIASEIATKKTLAFIPTQLLYYLPMQALGHKEGDGLHYLIQDKELVYLAGADVLKAVSAPASSTRGGSLVAFGNPTGANLPFAQAEVEAIGRIFPSSTIYAGPQATKIAMEDSKAQGARILHFATHGVLDSRDPDSSYIFLANGASKEGQLSFGEIEGLRLDKVDLVTLSACQTALQAQDPDGSEVASLAESFSRAKAHTVVASLWSVADESTQTLMVAFYKNLAVGQTKAAALRAAQLQLLQDPRTRHPYYWAPFILMGDWK